MKRVASSDEPIKDYHPTFFVSFISVFWYYGSQPFSFGLLSFVLLIVFVAATASCFIFKKF